MSILRAASPCLRPDRLRAEPVAPLLAALEAAVEELDDLLAEGSESTAGDILRHVRESELLELDDRFRPHFQENPVDDGSSGYVNVAAFLESSVAELWSYLRYLRDESPFATHQGVKGAQFERVLVVLDEESTHKQYSYGKYLGYEPLSEKDESHIAAGEESVLDRTRRLFYVCCSRAVKDLAVVVFTANVEAARAALLASQLFPANAIRDMRTLN
ncbi:hypothetical protein BGC_04870 [Burkholderia sp. 3C]